MDRWTHNKPRHQLTGLRPVELKKNKMLITTILKQNCFVTSISKQNGLVKKFLPTWKPISPANNASLGFIALEM